MDRNIYFSLAKEKNSNELGLRPNTNKMQRFNVMVPLFQLHKIWFPEELRFEACMLEAVDELTKAAIKKFKSKFDDFIDRRFIKVYAGNRIARFVDTAFAQFLTHTVNPDFLQFIHDA